MAYMNQERKSALVPKIKAILKRYGMKGSLSVENYSTLVLNLKSGKLDMIHNFNETCGGSDYQRARGFRAVKDNMQVNEYWYHDHFSGTVKEFLKEVITAMNIGNHDNSDIQTDYFDVGWYTNINVGKWNKPYVVEY